MKNSTWSLLGKFWWRKLLSATSKMWCNQCTVTCKKTKTNKRYRKSINQSIKQLFLWQGKVSLGRMSCGAIPWKHNIYELCIHCICKKYFLPWKTDLKTFLEKKNLFKVFGNRLLLFTWWLHHMTIFTLVLKLV